VYAPLASGRHVSHLLLSHATPQAPQSVSVPFDLHTPPQQKRPVAHVTQPPPPNPQALLAVPGLHVLPSQQPVVQLAVVHWHWPPTHACPLTQVETHRPPWQVSQGPHAWQARPPTPQAPLLRPGLQVLPSQQPSGQLAAVQTHDPLRHSVPEGHATQIAPLLPQAVLAVPGLQSLPSQHPVAQLAGVQTHSPPTQVNPWAHFVPQVPQLATSFWKSTQTSFGQRLGRLAGQSQPWLPLQMRSPGQRAPLSTTPSQSLSWPSQTSGLGSDPTHSTPFCRHWRVPGEQAP